MEISHTMHTCNVHQSMAVSFYNSLALKICTETTNLMCSLHIGNVPPPLDLAGSREQRGSAFELYRKPQLGNVPVHHHR